MRRLLFAPLCVFSIACASARPAGTPDTGAEHGGWVESTLAHMTLRDKAAQLVMPQVFADYVADDAPLWLRQKRYVTEDKVGGIIVSVGSPIEMAAKLNALQRLSPLPLLVGSDLEYGAGYRARGGYFIPNAIDLGGATIIPPEMAVGATGDTTLAYQMGSITAIEARALGIQLVFAPILDVNNNPANPVINTRSFGEDPAAVARLGAAYTRGVQAHGAVATGKHFPGHGDTEVNSHLAMPVVNVSRARLDSVELVPFRASIDAGLGAIMTFHGALPALDSATVPATLSRNIMTGLLRDQLHFGGLIISDALDMRGVMGSYGIAEATKRAIDAGVDVLLMPSDVTLCIDAVVAGVAEGRYPESRIDQSVRRILALKQRLGLERRRLVDLDSLRTIVGDTAHAVVARTIAERSITLVKDSLRLLPLGQLPTATRVLSVTFARRPDLSAGVAFDAELRRTLPAVRSVFVDADDPAASFARSSALADSADVVIVGSYVSHSSVAVTVGAPRAFVDFVRDLALRGKRPILVALGTPYLLQQVPEAPAYLVAWTGFPVAQTAAARALLGLAPITGRLPVRIPPLAAIGAGESRPALAAGTAVTPR